MILATEIYANLIVRAASAKNLSEHFILVSIDVLGSRFMDPVSSRQDYSIGGKHSQAIQSLAAGSFLIMPAAKTPKAFVKHINKLQDSEEKHFYNSLEPNWYEKVTATLQEQPVQDWELSSAVFVRSIFKRGIFTLSSL